MQQNLQQFKIADNSFKLKHTSKYYLTVKISENGLSYCILDPNQQRFVALANYDNIPLSSIGKFISTDEVLSQKFAKTKVIVPSNEHTLIPVDLFDIKNLNEYTAVNFIKQEGKLMIDHVPSLGAKQIYMLPPSVQQITDQYFAGAEIYYEGTPLLEGLIRQSNHTEKQLLYINVMRNYIQVAVFNYGKLLFFNHFDYTTSDEFIYFPQFVCSKLGFSPKDLNVFMLGDIKPEDSNYQLIHEHFRKVNFGELSNELYFSKALTQIPQHRFYSLFNIELCA
ncbi:DUF3822 family protein [Solitalea lacus]|uniref:DUF3822 family protein n=1 Tax=Solitalea lacus TaxID=2911172 RepID=UPI001EDC3ADB|nr:DUF3822 family protein [Solitalea lacus]UKJ09042.1 DUF3822 family protein [Solitalea lacus]